MMRIAFAVLLVLPALCVAQTTQSSPSQADVRTFDLTPTPPPVPALKYELLYDTLADRSPGNAAILYMQTTMLLGPTADTAQKALEAYDANDLETFDKLAAELDKPAVFKNLDLAARRDSCDWQPPIREFGAEAYLRTFSRSPTADPHHQGAGALPDGTRPTRRSRQDAASRL
jgi:hypothetical protein